MPGLKEQRAAKLAKLVEVEGFESEEELFAAAVADSVRSRIIPAPSRRNFRNPASRPRLLARQRCGRHTSERKQSSLLPSTLRPALCCNPDNPDCDYTAEMEPDQDRGWCEMCGAGTLVSGLVLGGII